MSEPSEAAYEAALAAFYRPAGTLQLAIRATVDAVWALAYDAGMAEGRRQAAGTEQRREGICGEEAPSIFVNCAATFPVICVLSHGHASSWHEGDNGSRWRSR